MKIRVSPLDRLFSRYIRLKAAGKCEYCGRELRIGKLETSHFHGRRNRITRYDPDNVAAVCFSCHVYLGENPDKHVAFFKKRLGSERYEALNMRAETTAASRGAVKRYEEALAAKFKKLIEIEQMEEVNDGTKAG